MSVSFKGPSPRAELNRLLILNALGKEINWITFSVLAIGGIVAGITWVLAIAISLLVYLVMAAITYLDEDEAKKVGERLRSRREQGRVTSESRIGPGALAPPVAARLQTILEQERRIREVIDEADLPYSEISVEVDRFVRAAEKTASRANLLNEYLTEEDRGKIEQRLDELRGLGELDTGKQALAEALTNQITAIDRMEKKLDSFHTEMERIAVELGNIRGQLLSASAATETVAQRELAAGVRGLREEVTAIAEGLSEVIEETEDPRSSPSPLNPDIR